MNHFFSVILLLMTLISLSKSAFALSDQEIFQKSKGSTVYLSVHRDFEQSAGEVNRGTGFLVSKSGLILTVDHVKPGVNEHLRAVIGQREGQSYKLQFIAGDETNDVALWALPETTSCYRALKLSRSAAVRVPLHVLVIGFPGDLSVTPSPATVTNVAGNNLVLSGALDHGNSGSPVFNVFGEVIGIVKEGREFTANSYSATKISAAISLIEGAGISIDELGRPCNLNPIFADITVVYFKKSSDDGLVEKALNDNDIYYELREAEVAGATNVIVCTPDVSAEALKALARYVRANGIKLKRILRSDYDWMRKRITLETAQFEEDSPVLTRTQIDNITGCPEDKYPPDERYVTVKFCNQTSENVWVVLDSRQSRFTKDRTIGGWYAYQPGECRKLKSIVDGTYYFHVNARTHRSAGAHKKCAPYAKFSRNYESIAPCLSGDKELGFHRRDTYGSDDEIIHVFNSN